MPDMISTEALPATSLIICSRNRPTLLLDTVMSVLSGDDVPTELIIIDQSDTPNAELAEMSTERECELRYYTSSSVGLSRARNEGIEAARHDVLVFTDDDMLVSASWFRTLVLELVHAGPRAVVTGRVMPAEERPDGFVPSTKVDTERAVYEGRIAADVLYPHNMAMYRVLAEQVGPFDARLGVGSRYAGAEDNDYCFRVLEAGNRIIYTPDAVAHHRAWRSYSEYLPLRWNYGRGQGAYYAKHLDIRDGYMLNRFRWEVGFRFRRVFRRLRSQPRRAAGEIVYLLGLVSGAVQWLLMERANGHTTIQQT